MSFDLTTSSSTATIKHIHSSIESCDDGQDEQSKMKITRKTTFDEQLLRQLTDVVSQMMIS